MRPRIRERWMTALQSVLLSTMLSFGAMIALVTGFDLPILQPYCLFLVCAGAACLFALIWAMPAGGRGVLLLGALGCWYLYRHREIAEQFLLLICRISRVYDSAYHLGYLSLGEEALALDAADWPVCLWAAAICLGSTYCVSRGGSLLIPALLAVIPLGACFVVTDTQPAAWSIACFCYAMVLLLLCAEVRRDDPVQGNRLTLLCSVPVGLALGALLLAVPQGAYINQSENAREWIVQLLEKTPERLMQLEQLESITQALPLRAQEQEQVDLAQMGAVNPSQAPLMYVQADVGGTLYLRGQDYDAYSGRDWQSTAQRAEDFSCAGESLGTVSVETVGRLDRLYLPYYPGKGITLVGGQLENTGLYESYFFTRTGLPGDLYTLLEAGTEADWTPQERYLALPDAARPGLARIGEPLVRGASTATAKAERIGAYVRTSAVYDRQAERMDPAAEDFALWFLEEGEKGYCVHFATAAVALLRSVGVEARYVSGYMLRVQPGERTVVTGENAHAWAEYYEPRLKLWLPLEATPSAGQTPGGSQQIEAATSEPAPVPGSVQPETARPGDPQTVLSHEPNMGPAPTVPQAPGKAEGWSIPQWVGKLVQTAIIGALGLGILWAQRRLRILLRQRRQHRGSANAQALARWQELERLCRLQHRKPPEDLHQLALKAKFSQHSLTDRELMGMDSALQGARSQLCQANIFMRLIYEYVFAVM